MESNEIQCKNSAAFNGIILNPCKSKWIIVNPIESYRIQLNQMESTGSQLNQAEFAGIPKIPTESNGILLNQTEFAGMFVAKFNGSEMTIGIHLNPRHFSKCPLLWHLPSFASSS